MFPRIILNEEYTHVQLITTKDFLFVEYNPRKKCINFQIMNNGESKCIVYIPYVGVFKQNNPIEMMKIGEIEYIQLITNSYDKVVVYEIYKYGNKFGFIKHGVDESILRGFIKKGDAVDIMYKILRSIVRDYLKLNLPLYYVTLKVSSDVNNLKYEIESSMDSLTKLYSRKIILYYMPGFCIQLKQITSNRIDISILSNLSTKHLVPNIIEKFVQVCDVLLEFKLGKADLRIEDGVISILDLFTVPSWKRSY